MSSSVQIPPTPEAHRPFPHATSPAVCLPLLILALVVIGLWQSRQRSSGVSQTRRNSDGKLETKLVNLLNGDHATASRLLDRAKDSHPGGVNDLLLNSKLLYQIHND